MDACTAKSITVTGDRSPLMTISVLISDFYYSCIHPLHYLHFLCHDGGTFHNGERYRRKVIEKRISKIHSANWLFAENKTNTTHSSGGGEDVPENP